MSAQKVGLVLSGGGAKGLYHIGVMKALEENGIPIDYVSGTSMGAIIGGLYSIGYSPEEIEQIFRSGQVNTWMSGKIENQYIYYFKQPRPNASMITLRFDLKKKSKPIPVLPTNLIPSRQIDMAFIKYFSAATAQCNGNFDNLFVPFRCIASDATERKEIVYRSGDLGRAIRASMTIPLVFKPLEQDSSLLYDGGIYNNFPWQPLVEDFKPDILIGSKCTAGNAEPDPDNIMEQIFALTMMHTDYELPSENDILIEHAFTDVSTLDFGKVDYVINKGYSDAIAAMPLIKERINRRVEKSELDSKRMAYKSQLPNMIFDKFEIKGLNPAQTRYVKEVMRLNGTKKHQEEFFNYDTFKSEYFKLLSEGEIEGNYPDVKFNDSTRLFNLTLNLQTKPSFKIMFGGNISSTSMNQAYIGAEFRRLGRNSNIYNLDTYFSNFYTSIYVGGRTDFVMRTPFAIEYGYNYNYYNYFRSNYGYISRFTDLAYSKYKDSYLTAALSFPLDRFVTVSLRANAANDNYRYYQKPGYTDADEMDNTRFRYIGLKLAMERNSFNYLLYPTRGLYQDISAIYIRGNEVFTPGAPEFNDYQPASKSVHYWFGGEFKREHYIPFFKWLSMGYLLQGVITNHRNFSNDFSTNLTSPAFTPTPHSKLVYLKEFRSNSFLGFGLMPTFEFTPKLYLQTGFYGFLPDKLNSVQENIEKRFRYIFNSTLVYQSPIGPVSLSLSKYDAQHNNNNWFLTFNFGFTLFNKKGLFY